MSPFFRIYLPVSDGEFAELIDDLGRRGASCSVERPSFVRCVWRGVHFNVIHDVEGNLKAQILDDAGLGVHAWDFLDPIFVRMGSHERTGVAGASLRDLLTEYAFAIGVGAGAAFVIHAIVKRGSRSRV